MTATAEPTLSHAVGPTEPALLEQTIGGSLDSTVERFGDREALVDRGSGVRYTWAELGEAVDRLARGFVASGVDASSLRYIAMQ